MPRLSKIGAAALAAFGWTGLSSVTADYLVVAGGGGGSSSSGGGGGGGAGGYQSGTTSLNPTLSYTVTVGAGGAGGLASIISNGSAGSNSQLGTLTASVGGGQGVAQGVGGNGGSGGGAGDGDNAGVLAGGTGTSGQGNNGGSSANQTGGGGGGANATTGTGGNGNASGNAGNGGNGTASSISGSSVTYAGGGGGGQNTVTGTGAGTGGSGGGGNGGRGAAGTAGTVSLGAGGGGGGRTSGVSNYNGGQGGSGVVIISYPSPQQFGGGVVTVSGGNTIHTFTTSGTLSPLNSLTANFLVVAGGAGGGEYWSGGGGGAGGLRSSVTNTGGGGTLESALFIDTNSTYLVTVGGGGAGAATGGSGTKGANGSNSAFLSITSTGGGAGGLYDNFNGNSGGSGGGGFYGGTGGAGTANQGRAGGAGASSGFGNESGGGGGGGAGTAGAAGAYAQGGNGGDGVAVAITGSSVTYGGGGGGSVYTGTGGTGGSGGGANGVANGGGNGKNGTANTGGGASGTATSTLIGGNGGSGVVIISYPGTTQQMAGGTVTVAGGNVIHTFTNSGYLAPIITVNNSLRFRQSVSARLTRTPSVASNRKTYTISAWVKLGSNASSDVGTIFCGGDSSTSASTHLYFYLDKIRFYFGGAGGPEWTTSQVFRDYSSWYHIVAAVDTTQATFGNRLKLYINGTEVTSWSAQGTGGNTAQNSDTQINNNVGHGIGSNGAAAQYLFDGYMTEFNLIDGLQLTPNSFGTFNSLGSWQPIRYGGSYGTNGFYLPFNQSITTDYLVVAGGGGGGWYGGGGGAGGYRCSVTGESSGGGASAEAKLTLNITGRYTVTVGAGGAGQSSSLSANGANGSNSVFSTITSTGGGGGSSQNSGTANSGGSGGGGSSATSPYAGGAGTANQGFAGATVTANGSYHGGGGGAGAVGNDWSGSTGGAGGNGVTSSITGSSVTRAGGGGGRGASGGAGGSGGGGAGGAGDNAGTVGTDYTGSGGGGGNTGGKGGDGVVIISYNGPQQFTGGTVTSSGGKTIHTFTSSGTLVGNIATDYSPQGNNWTANNISLTSGSTYDSMTDVPTLTSATTANYGTLNPLWKGSLQTLSNANLTSSKSSGTSISDVWGTFGMTSGKWYFECSVSALSATVYIGVGQGGGTGEPTDDLATSPASYFYSSVDGNKFYGNTGTAYGDTFGAGNVIGCAIDMDNGKIWWSKDGTWQASGDPAAGTNAAFTDLLTRGSNAFLAFSSTNGASNSNTLNWNFGQQPFSYTPPTGFKALNTFNFSTPTVTQSNKHFDVTTFTGNASTNVIANSGFMQPDMVWLKSRTNANSHTIFDSIRGVNNLLYPNLPNDATTGSAQLTAFNSNGFTLGASENSNDSFGELSVGWQWRASNAAGVSNTAGTIASTVSANTTAGFSIVTYTGTGGTGTTTVGHGCQVGGSPTAPSMVIIKRRNASANWAVYLTALTSTSYYLVLNSSNPQANYGSTFISPSSSTLTIAADSSLLNTSTGTYLAYCFAEVAGYSKFGSYIGTGAGDSNGPFIYCGFRPALIIIKVDTVGYNWAMMDIERPGYNSISYRIFADVANEETTTGDPQLDFLSNGFKLKAGNANYAGTAWFMAFAENPFKYSNAR
jgi:hypothetical protein